MKYLITVPRAILLPFMMGLFTLLCSFWVAGCSLLFRNRKFDTQNIRFWSKGLCWMCGIRVKVTGLENIPDGGVLFVFNHQSHMDIPVLHAAIPHDFRFGAKIELFKIPVFASAMNAVGVLPIPRAQRNQAIRVLNAAEERLRAGESFVLAPEGTRQDTGEIGSFRTGPFVFAINAQVPIVPVVLKGLDRILPKGSLAFNVHGIVTEAEVKVLPAFSTIGYSFEMREEVKTKIRNQMVEAFEST